MLHLTEKSRVPGPFADTLTLPFERRQKSRQRVMLDSGREAGIVLAPGTSLRDGDVLRANSGELVRVRAAVETVSTARTGDPLRLARACYHLGNRHVPVQIGPGWARFLHDHVLDDMLRQLGLLVIAEQAPFEPEGGAYAGRHAHGHDHLQSHGHKHAADGAHDAQGDDGQRDHAGGHSH
jgi:urease accessory protein